MRTLLLLFFCSLSTTVFNQSSYTEALLRGDTALTKNNYQKALTHFLTAYDLLEVSSKKEKPKQRVEVPGKVLLANGEILCK